MVDLSLLARFAHVICHLPEDMGASEPMPGSLRIKEGGGGFETYYAPFDHVNPGARIAIVGITPGRSQALAALEVARSMLRAGRDLAEAARSAKVAASFSGPMRTNLVAMLDTLGVPSKLGLGSASELWGHAASLAHFTSVLRYPVFCKGKNYTGAGILGSDYLREQILTWFVEECRLIPGALVVPLGPAATLGCDLAVTSGALERSQVLKGLPHPSGANAERIAYFLGRKPRAALSTQTKAELIDAGREAATATLSAWRP